MMLSDKRRGETGREPGQAGVFIERERFAEGTTTVAKVEVGGRGKHRGITFEGVTRTLKEWARQLGVTSGHLRTDIMRRGGADEAIGYLAEQKRKREEGYVMRGSSTKAEGDALDTRIAAGSCANAHRDFAAGDKLEAVAHTYLAYRTLREVLRRNRFPLEEDEGRRR